MRKMLVVLGMMTSIIANGQCWKMVSAGQPFTVAIKTNGTLWAWGDNSSGEIGDGTLIQRSFPVQIGIDSNWKTISTGAAHTIALKTNGTLWAWGDNSFIQLGDSTNINRYIPVQIGADTNWKSVSGGHVYSVAIKNDGTLWAWGDNYKGQYGNGTINSSSSPKLIGTGTNWGIVSAAGNRTVAIKTNGTLWAWGDNELGEVGNGTTSYAVLSPIQIGFDSNWRYVEAGYAHTLAIKNNGTLWAWGWNEYGQLGLGDTLNKHSPIQVGSDSNWESVSAGFYHTIAKKNDGTIWGCGWNEYGQLGDGTSMSKKLLIQITSDTNWQMVSVGSSHTEAIRNDGTLWACGWNGSARLGDGTEIEKHSLINILCQSVLPLKLLFLTAKLQTPNSVALNWQTANEVNVSHINVQRSINGKDFTSIGKLNASCCSYEFTDNQLPITSDKLTLNYRLEIVDKDGSKTYSTVQQITIKPQTPNIIIFPNPAKDVVTIEYKGAKEILIIDGLGRTVKQFNNPTEHQTLNTKQLIKGIYVVKAVMNNGDIKTEKLVVE